MEDNIMPNDGAAFDWASRPSEDVALAAEQERKLAAAKPLIRDVVARLEARIEWYRDVDNIDANLEDEPEKYQRYALLHRDMRNALQDEKEFIESMLK